MGILDVGPFLQSPLFKTNGYTQGRGGIVKSFGV